MAVVEVYNYDVFLSFRGEDTRDSFTDHLYHGLTQAGICTFRDTEEINRGEELQREIERAIKVSRGSIVVLSQTYATSTWCLDELLLILNQKKQTEGSHFVLPVFHHVDPAHIRKLKGSFDIQVKPSSKWTHEKVILWKRALIEVANLSGFPLLGPETNTLKDIVDTIINKLGHKEVHLPPNIIGMEDRYNEIKSWLDECNLEFLAIYGMGGSGKTTFAKHIFNSNLRTFEYVSFLENIGRICKVPNDLLQLQKQLLKDISGGKKRKIPSVSQGTCMIEDALQKNKTLIVLDDISEYSQLVALLGTGKINTQSKIIITTLENTDSWFMRSCWRCQNYEMRPLNNGESLELLSRHAFGSKIPNDSYKGLLQEATQFCGGNPLALDVLGSLLSKNYTIPYWESLLSLNGKDIHARIQEALIRSYMSLPGTVKELFLHIACFFIDVDMDYVVQIFEPDYPAKFGIETLIDRCLLSVSPNKRLMMHRLLQEMGKNIVRQESINLPAKRSRVWLSNESYKILRKGKGSETVQGLALDMKMLPDANFQSSELKTDALQNMDNLTLLQLNFVELSGSYENFSEDLRWLCWLGFHLRTLPANLYMRNLVAIDMSYSHLEVFEPPMAIQSLKILNLKDSHKLIEILNIIRIPNLETLILWNCHSLINVCKTITDLKKLALLNMTGCKNLFNSINFLTASTSGGVVTKQATFSFPFSLNRLFLKDCHLECTDSLPLNFLVQPGLQYLNLVNSLFETLPCYTHLKNLQVLDLSFCSRLKYLEHLPNTLAELYIYYCELLERITFQSPQFTLQEFGYEGCINLYEIEGFIKLVLIANLDEYGLGHMNWLKAYQNLDLYLVGDDELTKGRSRQIQMLYEFNIMSISLPDIKDPNMATKYTSKSSSLSFDVPLCPKNKRLKGIDVVVKYAISGNEWAWFCKISTTNGIELMYNPRVFGKPESATKCIWLSYWPIGNKLNVGDTVSVSIFVLSGLEIHECGVNMVYSDEEILQDGMGLEDLSRFQLSTGAYYLCRHDFFELTEVGRLTPNWFTILVGDAIDYTEIRGWRKMGQPKQVNSSLTELKTIRCIIHGPQLEDIYNIAEMSKSYGDKSVAFTTSLLEGEMKSGTRSDETMEEIHDKQKIKSGDFISTFDDITVEESDPYSHEQKESAGMSKAFGSFEIKESDSPPREERSESVVLRLEGMESSYANSASVSGANYSMSTLTATPTSPAFSLYNYEKEPVRTSDLSTRDDSYVPKLESSSVRDGIGRLFRSSDTSRPAIVDSTLKPAISSGDDGEKLSLIKLASLFEVSYKKGAKDLNLSGRLMDQIEWLPDSIGKLSALITLDLSENRLVALPSSIGNLSSLTKLDLHSNKIIELPESIGDLIKLVHLDLRANQLTSLPPTFSKLLSLEELDLSSNNLSMVPESICSLTRLQKLSIKTNNIEELPYNISQCSSLKELIADYNKLKALPEAIGKIGSLERLSVRYNNIGWLPTTMASLTNLKELDVSFNELESVPESLCFVTTLVKINISNNFADLTSLPRYIGNLENLEELDISNNQIRFLPDSFSMLSMLHVLKAEGNPLEIPPLSIIDQGPHAVVQYMIELQEKKQVKHKKSWTSIFFSSRRR